MAASFLPAVARVERVYAAGHGTASGGTGRRGERDELVEEELLVEETSRLVEEELLVEETSRLVEEELLVEEISIDGMCGVY